MVFNKLLIVGSHFGLFLKALQNLITLKAVSCNDDLSHTPCEPFALCVTLCILLSGLINIKVVMADKLAVGPDGSGCSI